MNFNENLRNKNNYIDKQPKLNETIAGIHNILGINRVTQIYDGGPNELVPAGLFYNEVSGKIFEYLKGKGIRFYLDSEKKSELGYSDNHNKYIFLGLKAPRTYTKNMGIADSVNECTKTQLVFLHEMCHHLAWEINNYESFRKLFHICRSLRNNRPKNVVSGLGDMNFYQTKGINTQATEDCAELLRIYFMCRENESICFEYIRNKLHLQDDTACKTIFNLLSESVMYYFPGR